jgi:hypothetical protein
MADRGIMFSAAMVQALLAGRKTQTRRLATSPLRKCQIGDRLWVREGWSHTGDGVWQIQDARMMGLAGVIFMADGRRLGAKYWPSTHMPREFSRLTLLISDVRVERLQDITAQDAWAEGADPVHMKPGGHTGNPSDGWLCYQAGFRSLWDSLHDKPGERWQDNPELVALTFTVCHGNIDHIGAR